MKNNYEEIPSSVFDCLNQYSYEQLTAEQKTVVSAWFSPSEYNDLHAASHAVLRQQTISKKESIKQNLLHKFAQKQKPATKNWFRQEIALWKVAATLLLIGGLSYPWLAPKKTKQAPLLAQVDTVYLEAQPTTVYDTIYLQAAAKAKSPKTTARPSYRAQQSASNYLPEQTDIKINSMSSLESEPNQIRGNSLKHDTLLNTYGFVRL